MFVMIVINSKILGYCELARRVSVDSCVGDWNTFYWLITNCIQLFEKKGARKNMRKHAEIV